MNTMTRIALGTVALASALALAPAADSAQPTAHCKVLSTVTQTRSPSATAPHQVYPNGTGEQTRIVITERCQGKVSTIVGLWYYS